MVEETKDIIEVLQILGRYLPQGGVAFLFELFLKHDIRNVILRSDSLGLFLRGAWGAFNLIEREILIDLDTVKEKEESKVMALVLHEIAHSLPQIGADEEKANQWAYEKFTEFKSQKGMA
jgi:hypothetical protein